MTGTDRKKFHLAETLGRPAAGAGKKTRGRKT
jgi:hypothetical protein